jgi:hypothetical protein
MAPRIWLSGPRILNGLVRPGISFYARDLKRQPPGPIASKSVALLFVLTRADGAVMFGRDKTPETDGLQTSPDMKFAIIFAFRNPEAAEVVLAGAHKRLSKAAVDANGWLIGVSAGQVAAAIKSEARGLSHAFDIIHVRDGEEPKPKSNAGAWALAVIGSLVLLLVVIGLSTSPADHQHWSRYGEHTE